uniref:Chromo domain-containing protein n=1 Tax=Globodera pallida TaxID=36090 RepID=A0A183CTW7_GLOPA
MKVHDVFHGNMLSQYKEDTDFHRNQPRPPPIVTEEGEEEYEVERIIDWYQDPDGLKYRIRWKGYGPLEDTEERAEKFADMTPVMRRLSAAYGKAIMAGGPGEFAINCRATAPWTLKEARKLANDLEPGVSLGYIPLAKRGLIKWDEERKSLIVPGLGSLLWVSHPDARPSDPTNIGRSKYYHCRGCIGLTVRDVVTKSADAWN